MVSATPRPLYPRERPCTHCTGGWVDPQGRSGRVRNISPPTGFDPRTVQPIASRYTDCAIRAPQLLHVLQSIRRANKELLCNIPKRMSFLIPALFWNYTRRRMVVTYRKVVPKRRHWTSIPRWVISQKSADLFDTAAEVWNVVFPVTKTHTASVVRQPNMWANLRTFFAHKTAEEWNHNLSSRSAQKCQHGWTWIRAIRFMVWCLIDYEEKFIFLKKYLFGWGRLKLTL